MSDEIGTRINKYLSEIGFCSRRKADLLIEQERIKVNGIYAVMGQKVTGQEEIRVNNKIIKKLENKNHFPNMSYKLQKVVFGIFRHPNNNFCCTKC